MKKMKRIPVDDYTFLLLFRAGFLKKVDAELNSKGSKAIMRYAKTVLREKKK